MQQSSASYDSLRRLLARLGRGLRGFRLLSNDRLLSIGLRSFLLLCYVIICYVTVLAIGSIVVPGVPGMVDTLAPVPWWLNITALVCTGAGLVPVNLAIRRGVEHLIYSWPDDPYGAMSRLQASLLHGSAPQAIVPAVVAMISATLKLPYAAITSNSDGATVQVGAVPQGAERMTIALMYGETAVGCLEVAARWPGAALSSSELHLLNNLARQVGITLYAAQLSEAMQDSRAQLVAAREEERRRIRRDLHDGLGPTLAAMRIQLGVARRCLHSEPDTAGVLLDELRADVVEATGMIRRLVYDLRPPMLDEHGLAGALQSLERLVEPVALQLELPDQLPPLPAALEVALYRIAAEALHNVARHAHAESCSLRLDVTEQSVQLLVCDRGVGLPDGHRAGIGLAAMQERAEELSGSLSIESSPGAGVTVKALIPRRSPS